MKSLCLACREQTQELLAIDEFVRYELIRRLSIAKLVSGDAVLFSGDIFIATPSFCDEIHI